MSNYASPENFINQFGAHSSAEFLDRSENNDLTDAGLQAAVLDADVSGFDEADVAAQVVALASLNRYLTDATNEINSYITARYSLPIPAETITQSPLPRITCDIARYFAASSEDMMSEIIAKRYQDGIKWLKEISYGKAQLSAPGQKSREQSAGTGGMQYATGTQTDLDNY